MFQAELCYCIDFFHVSSIIDLEYREFMRKITLITLRCFCLFIIIIIFTFNLQLIIKKCSFISLLTMLFPHEMVC